MEALVILLLIVILIALLSGNSQVRKQLSDLETQLRELRAELKQQPQQKRQPPPPVYERDEWYMPPPPPQPAPLPEPPPPPVPPVPEPEPAPLPPVQRRPLPQPDPPLLRTPPQFRPEGGEPEPFVQPAPARAAYTPPPPPPREPPPGFFERHPDLEKFIGENLVSKIGIAILVIGIGFFVKYAIDQNWIGPAGRVAIGMLCGGILIGLAHWLQKSYKAFGSVLVGGGLAVCYYTISLAYQDYGLMPQALAFGIMVLLTAFACVLSLLYDRQEVAVIALVGGFTAPFLVSNGSGNYVVLFSYLLVLNAGLLLIAYRKSWRLLNGIAFAATVLLFSGWLATLKPLEIRAYRGGFWFATAFYLLFFAINLAHNIRHRQRFIASDFSIILANTGLFFGGGLYMLDAGGLDGYRGLFAIVLAALNLGITAALARRQAIDKAILYLLIGITLSFVSLAAPLQLHGHSITLFWGAETVVVLWMYQRTGYGILRYGMIIVWACSLISLLLDWGLFYFDALRFPVIFNRGFLTTLYVAAAQFVIWWLCRRQPAMRDVGEDDAFLKMIRRPAVMLGSALVFIAGLLEIYTQIEARAQNDAILTQYLLFYTLSFFLITAVIVRRIAGELSLLPQIAIILPCLAFFLTASVSVYQQQAESWATYGRFGHFSIHWLSLAIVILLSRLLMPLIRGRAADGERSAQDIAAAIFGLIVVSVECGLILRIALARGVADLPRIDENYVRIGLPIIWGLYSFALMWIGMRRGQRVLRICSLTIFTLTLLKLFLVDIRALGPGGKIAAFISLGVLLLVVSFMYQRLRRLIIEDKNDEKPVE